MRATAADFEQMLRDALDQAETIANQADKDLLRIASEAARAVSKVTDGGGILELVPLSTGGDPRPTYRLVLRREGSAAPASDLGVFRVSEAGYPVDHWPMLAGWTTQPNAPSYQYMNAEELESTFNWMLSKPDSKLVVLVNFIRQQATRK